MYRFNVWAPPTDVWDIIVEYVGFIVNVSDEEDRQLSLYARLERANIDIDTRREVYHRLGLDTYLHRLCVRFQINRGIKLIKLRYRPSAEGIRLRAL